MLIRLKKIRIPEYFKKPNILKKMSREIYYLRFNKLPVPIVIDKHNELVDGYTSYLIAKEYGKKIVKVKRV